MKFDHPELENVWLTCKEELTMRDVLMYDGAVEGRLVDTLYTRLWKGVIWLVDEWHYDGIKLDDDIDALLDEAADMQVINVVKWAGLCCFQYRHSLEPEKN